jgi:hypothetical protein
MRTNVAKTTKPKEEAAIVVPTLPPPQQIKEKATTKPQSPKKANKAEPKKAGKAAGKTQQTKISSFFTIK